MNQSLTLSGEVYRRLAQGAAKYGMTIESLLDFFSELAVLPGEVREGDQRRTRDIERLLERFRAGLLDETDHKLLDQLIEADYQRANARADSLIRAKQRRARNDRVNGKHQRQ